MGLRVWGVGVESSRFVDPVSTLGVGLEASSGLNDGDVGFVIHLSFFDVGSGQHA